MTPADFGAKGYPHATVIRPGWLARPPDLFGVLVFDRRSRAQAPGVRFLAGQAGRLAGWFRPTVMVTPAPGHEDEYVRDAARVFDGLTQRPRHPPRGSGFWMLLTNAPPSAHKGRQLPVVAIDLTRAETWEVYCFAIATRWLSSVSRFRSVWRRRGLAQKLFTQGLSEIDFSSPRREETALDVLAVYQTACAVGVVVEFWNFHDRTPRVFREMVNNDLRLADRLRGVLETRASVQTRFAQEFPEYQPLPGEAAIRELWP